MVQVERTETGCSRRHSTIHFIPLEAWIYACVLPMFVRSCAVTDLTTGWFLVQGDLTHAYKRSSETRKTTGPGPHWSFRHTWKQDEINQHSINRKIIGRN